MQSLQAKTFEDGEGVVSLPKGEPFLTMFNKRKSKHVSHTPRAEAAIQRFGTSGAQAPRTGYSVHRREYEHSPGMMRRHRFTPSSSQAAPSAMHRESTKGDDASQAAPSAMQSTDGTWKLTPEQETEFIRRYRACGSIREAILQMHISYGRYQKHASRIVKERNLK